MKPTNARTRTPLVTVVIPVFNKCALTVQCLDAIERVGARAPFEVVVVDDASIDATPQRLAERAGRVRTIRHSANRGFGCSCNEGAAAAAGKYVLFLNNDTIPLPGWLDALVDELQTRPEVAVVGSRLLYEGGLVQHAGIVFERGTRNLYHPNRLLRGDDPRVNRRRELQAVTGACLMIRTHLFREYGGFFAGFQTGYEDVDLCLAMRRRGGRVVYQPKSALYHLESQTPGRLRHETENWTLFHRRWADQLLTDEDDYHFTDGLRVQRRRDEHGDVARCVRFASDEERTRWALVAECERAAAAGKSSDVTRCLERSRDWPDDGSLRRWAWVLCRRLGLRAAGRAHLEAALRIAPTGELRAYLALDEGADGADGVPWEAALVDGFRRLHAGDAAAAGPSLEAALQGGAPPHWALRGLWDAARAAGDERGAATFRAALLGMRRVDPDTARELAREADGAEAGEIPSAA